MTMKLKIEEDDSEEEELSSVVVERFWEDKWKNKDEIEKALIMHNYILEKYKLNSFGLYIYVMEYIIKNSGVAGLNQSVDKIVAGKPFNSEPNRDTEASITTMLLNNVEKMLKGLGEDEPEPEPEIKDKPKQEKPLILRVYEVYNQYKRKQEAYKIINEKLK